MVARVLSVSEGVEELGRGVLKVGEGCGGGGVCRWGREKVVGREG